MRNALRVTTDGAIELLDLDAPRGSHETLKYGVGGTIAAIDLTERLTIYCDDNGKVYGLPVNALATTYFQHRFGPVDIITGDVVFTGGVDDEGDTIGLTEEQLNVLRFIAEIHH